MSDLKSCPFCGSEVEVNGGPEAWVPTFNDPDSGGDPYYIQCKCGCEFQIGYCDFSEIREAWNKRVDS